MKIMMKSVVFFFFFSTAVHAFAPPAQFPSTTTTTTQLFQSIAVSKTHVTKAGGGIQPTTIEYGNCQLFDPNMEGKLGNTLERIAQGHEYGGGTTVTPTTVDAQHWLEDIGIPQHFAKPSNPVTATVLDRYRVIGDDAPGDIQHVVLQLPEGMHYVEGQSLSVLPAAGLEDKPKPRLYSIASTRYGDNGQGNTVSLCVRRAVYVDPVTGMEDPTKKGVCSNYLCDITPGTQVQVAGPVGKTMLLPEDPSQDVIMVATGTGIAPFRAFLHRLFYEQTVARHLFTGQAWLILGVPTTSGLLYPEELQQMQANAANANQLRIDYAISREQYNPDGSKRYVQHVLAENAPALLEKLQAGASIYFCGLKGMMPGILESLEQVCAAQGLDFAQKQKEWKDNHQWHVEVY